MPAFLAVINANVIVCVVIINQMIAKEPINLTIDEGFMLVTSKQVLQELYQVVLFCSA